MTMGFYNDPYQRFGTLDDEMLRAMRLVVDTGIHAKGWTREQAIDYMLANSSMGKTDATAEVERYIAIPSQALAYKIGALTIQRLRAKAEAELGAEVRHPRLPRPGADDRRAAAGDPRAEDRPLDRRQEGELNGGLTCTIYAVRDHFADRRRMRIERSVDRRLQRAKATMTRDEK